MCRKFLLLLKSYWINSEGPALVCYTGPDRCKMMITIEAWLQSQGVYNWEQNWETN